VLAAANRDPDQFDEPNEFNIGHQNNKHVSFGLGPHFCPGTPLARLKAQIAIPSLLRRLPNLRLADNTNIEFGPNNFFRRLTALPLESDVGG
jgi:cytochrome P450